MDPTRTPQQAGLEVRYDTRPASVDAGRPGSWDHHNPTPHNGHGHGYAAPAAVEQKILAVHGGYQPLAGHAQTHADPGAAGKLEDQRAAAAAAPRRPPWLFLGLGGLIVFVLAGVIGGVAGWRVTADLNQRPAGGGPGNADGGGSGGGGKGGGGGTSSSSNATEIMQNSALAAVGWRFGSDVTLQVLFQGPDSTLRRLQYMTLYRNWTAPMEMDAAPRAGSPLGASQLWIKPDPVGQPLDILPAIGSRVVY